MRARMKEQNYAMKGNLKDMLCRWNDALVNRRLCITHHEEATPTPRLHHLNHRFLPTLPSHFGHTCPTFSVRLTAYKVQLVQWSLAEFLAVAFEHSYGRREHALLSSPVPMLGMLEDHHQDQH